MAQRANEAGECDYDELVQIYSIVRSNMFDWDGASVWAITRTIVEESKKHSIDPILVLAVIHVESRFQSAAVSPGGARGLMQIVPFVGEALAQKIGLTGDPSNPSTSETFDLDDPILNIKLGIFYLNHLKESFRDLKLALTAYNWGPTEIKGRLADEVEIPSEYAMKVLSAYHQLQRKEPAKE